MIKATGSTKDGRDLIVFGLSEENIRLLREGKPIVVDGREIGRFGEVFCIFAGTTEHEMAAKMRADGLAI